MSFKTDFIGDFREVLLRRWKIVLMGLMFGVIIYIRMIVERLATSDGLWIGFELRNYYDWEDSLGRFGLRFFAALKNYYINPSLGTIFCILMLSIAAALIAEIFELGSCLRGGLIAALLLVSPAFCSLLGYYFTADAYSFSYLLSILFVLIIVKSKSRWSVLKAAIVLTVSLSLYQGYIAAAAALSLLYLIYCILFHKRDSRGLVSITLRFLAGGILSVYFYINLFRLNLILRHINASTRADISSMGEISLSDLPSSIKNAYILFADYFLTDKWFNNSWFIRGKANLIMIVAVTALIIFIAIKEKVYSELPQFVALIIFTLLIPPVFCMIRIIAPSSGVYGCTGVLQLMHMNFLYVFLIILSAGLPMGKIFSSVARVAAVGIAILGVYVLTIYTQVFQTIKEMEYARTYTVANMIIDRVSELEEFDTELPVAVVGTMQDGCFPRTYSDDTYKVVKGTEAVYGYIMWDDTEANQCCWNMFFKEFCGVDFMAVSPTSADRLPDMDEFKSMPVFPAEGSVKMIGGSAVVKLSD